MNRSCKPKRDPAEHLQPRLLQHAQALSTHTIFGETSIKAELSLLSLEGSTHA